jgi:Tol biopolymer transport system component
MPPLLPFRRLALVSLLAISCSDSPVEPALSPESIVFNSDRDGNFEIYRMNTDGTGLVNLTNNPAGDRQPVWSPDGLKIAFVSEREGREAIYVMNADGSNVVRLSGTTRGDAFPAWTGSKILFARDLGGPPHWIDLFVMNSDGTGVTNVTNNPDFVRGSSLSKNGARIVFDSDRDFDIDFTELTGELFVMNADGSNVVNLTNTDAAEDGFPEWSPDGARIAFHTDRTGNYEIFVMGPDGSNPVNLTNHPAHDYSPSWSSDGARIVFESAREGGSQLYVMNADGSSVRRITTGNAIYGFPAFRPIGTYSN